MSLAVTIDGRSMADRLNRKVRDEVTHLRKSHRLTPGLAVVLVGSNAASEIYVRTKARLCEEVGMKSFAHHLPADVREEDLLTLIHGLNVDPDVHGILVQLPLPPQIRGETVLAAIDPAKDVDGFHVINVGRLATGDSRALVPCTPTGCMMLIRSQIPDPAGMRAVVIGRSNIVGKPMAQLLLAADCTVVIAHSKTTDLASECRRADILIAATGRPEMVKGDWIKPGATVIDVGINRVPGDGGKTRLVGDVDYAQALKVAGAVTPVPGGVGPMTIACVILNTLRAACASAGLPEPKV